MKEQDIDKIYQWIRSCNNEEQLKSCEEAAAAFNIKYEDEATTQKLLNWIEYRTKELPKI